MSVSYHHNLQPQLAVDVIIDQNDQNDQNDQIVNIDKFQDFTNNDDLITGSTYRVGTDHEICIFRKTQDPLPFHSFSISVETNRPIDNITVKLIKLNYEITFTYHDINSSLITLKTELNHPYGLHYLKIYIPKKSIRRAEIMRKRREKKAAKKIRNEQGLARRLPPGETDPMELSKAFEECTTLFFQREAMNRTEKWNQRSHKKELKKLVKAKGLLRRLPDGIDKVQLLYEAYIECIETFYLRQMDDFLGENDFTYNHNIQIQN